MITIIRKLKICSVCTKPSVLWRSNPALCKQCSLQSNAKNRTKSKKCTTKVYNYKRKTTGERELFLNTWLKRVHICENCTISLGNEPKTFYFSHIKSKGAHPELRLDENNIELLCLDCHQAWEFNRDNYYKRKKPLLSQ